MDTPPTISGPPPSTPHGCRPLGGPGHQRILAATARFCRYSLWIALVLAPAVVACGRSSPTQGSLTPQEQRLVDESLALMHLRIEQNRDPDRAQELRDALPPLMSKQELEGLLDALALDPLRGQRVLDAIHDSLQARRERIFPPAQGGFSAEGTTSRPEGTVDPD